MKKSLMLVSLTAAGLLLLVACSGTSGSTTPSDVAAGQKLYQADCASCHGPNAAGGIKIGQATSADIRAKALQDTFKSNTDLIKRAILDGKDEEGKDLDSAMPRFTGKLSDADVTAIIDYLKTLR